MNPEERELIDKINTQIKNLDNEFDNADIGKIMEKAIDEIEAVDEQLGKTVERKKEEKRSREITN